MKQPTSKDVPIQHPAANPERKFLYQFIDHEKGSRSEPFIGDWETVAEILNAREKDQLPHDDDYLLLVAILEGEEQTIVPKTPLIKVSTFLQFKSDQTNIREA